MKNELQIAASPFFLKHECAEPHVENALRLKTILETIQTHPELSKLSNQALRPASEMEVVRVHTLQLLKQLKETTGSDGFLDPDTYYVPESFEVALNAAGTTIDLAKKIWNREVKRGFSLLRPPGHHATREDAMGFCLLNHVAIAVQAVLDSDPNAKVAVVDFDLHHGNGTQSIFYNNPRVLFVSSHRYPFYPGTGALDEMGEGKGKGLTVNFPLSDRYQGNFFTYLYGQTVLPILEEFSPDMIFVSAGYDGHVQDPMQGFRISTEDYRVLTRQLIQAAEKTAKGRLLFCLEGGYDPRALADSVVASLEEMKNPKPLEQGIGLQDPLHEKFAKHFSQVFSRLK